MTHHSPTKEELNTMVRAVDVFSKMLLSRSFPDIHRAMNCAKNVENIYNELKSKELLEEFIQHMCRTVHQDETDYDSTVMQYACDVVLETILSDSGTQTLGVLHCANSYISLCGKERFNYIVSKIIIRSEACRVLLDLLVSTDKDPKINKIFQANLLLKTLTKGENEKIAYNWLTSNHSSRMIIAFQAVSTGGLDHIASKALIKGFTSVLKDRQESALLYWSAVITNPTCISVLKNSRTLFYASLDFLSKTAENFELSSEMSWISQETGPCHIINFETLVMYLKHFITVDLTLAVSVRIFVEERCSSPGCALWEDVSLNLPQ